MSSIFTGCLIILICHASADENVSDGNFIMKKQIADRKRDAPFMLHSTYNKAPTIDYDQELEKLKFEMKSTVSKTSNELKDSINVLRNFYANVLRQAMATVEQAKKNYETNGNMGTESTEGNNPTEKELPKNLMFGMGFFGAR